MTVELMPVGLACNLKCTYCYEDNSRFSGNSNLSHTRANVPAMLDAIPKGSNFTIFGGEPLLAGKEVLCKIFEHGLKTVGHNSIQTNGVLIDDAMVVIFKKYNVSVGISIDGHAHHNNARVVGSPTKTLEATEKTEAAIDKLTQARIIPSIIVTLHRINASPKEIDAFIEWLEYLEFLGVRDVRLHFLEQEEIHSKLLALPEDELYDALIKIYEWSLQHQIRFDIFNDIKKLLTEGDKNTTCVWQACDPQSTPAVYGIDADGSISNCARTYKTGINYRKADDWGNERYIALYNTSQDAGGCSGCRFFYACKGYCPGTSIDGDWRNRTEHCGVIKRLFTYFEAQIESPISMDPIRRQELENEVLNGRNERKSNEHTDTPHQDWYALVLPTERGGTIRQGSRETNA